MDMVHFIDMYCTLHIHIHESHYGVQSYWILNHCHPLLSFKYRFYECIHSLIDYLRELTVNPFSRPLLVRNVHCIFYRNMYFLSTFACNGIFIQDLIAINIAYPIQDMSLNCLVIKETKKKDFLHSFPVKIAMLNLLPRRWSNNISMFQWMTIHSKVYWECELILNKNRTDEKISQKNKCWFV